MRHALLVRGLTLQFFLLSSLAIGQGVQQLAVGQSVVTLPPDAMERLTKITPYVAMPLSQLTLGWTSAGSGANVITLRLTLTLGASFASGEKQTTPVGVSGTLDVSSGKGRGHWAVEQENFRRFAPYADYLPGTGKLTLLLPVAFVRPGSAQSDALHALLLIPCRLRSTELTCDSPRQAFAEAVQRSFPGERPIEEVLPFAPRPDVSASASVGGDLLGPPNRMGCCFGDSGILGICWFKCISVCPLPPCHEECPTCFGPPECINCQEFSCSICGGE